MDWLCSDTQTHCWTMKHLTVCLVRELERQNNLCDNANLCEHVFVLMGTFLLCVYRRDVEALEGELLYYHEALLIFNTQLGLL